ncbi:Substrate-specific component FolT of folate ECF [Mycoplasmopsis meleagridis]|uniref:Substrate-specific component FolT of folate ECF transporter n=1 Tax=Mycoplasmopsis meleagridis ATCC 25294 TaxID=1264554 RepID=A0A0F5H0Z6_9BACT|nr:ECF transporter S component [Mycoplasmopsis meleagridis]KKB26969.1 Substrate-specific component FolT of folate ECF transporter [Mycoplasmopsis meleagridis ATCC 25294]OAD18558.1 Substrate-specific component FolT of folate ECF [Mycoplasmopsis meleagridis]VEU77573.1 Uncharacterised protein [Mycoplasmopsis meleagridis]
MDKYQTKNLLLKEKVEKIFKNGLKSAKLTIFDITLMGIMLGVHLAIVTLANYTILKIFPIQIELIFFLFYGLIFAWWKGAILALLADTLSLLLNGQIGTWYWLYAIMPVIIVTFSSFYQYIFKKGKYVSIILSFILFILASIIMFYAINSRLEGDEVIFSKSVSKKTGQVNVKSVSIIFIYSFLSIYIAFGLIVNSTFAILYFKKKKDKYLNYIKIFALITLAIMIFRWSIDPLIYINWYNYVHRAGPTNKLKNVGSDYVVILIPIIIKSVVPIPIYIIVLSPVYEVIIKLKNQYYANNIQIEW